MQGKMPSSQAAFFGQLFLNRARDLTFNDILIIAYVLYCEINIYIQ